MSRHHATALGYEIRADGNGIVLIRNSAAVGYVTGSKSGNLYRAATIRGAYGRFHTVAAAIQFLIDNDHA